MKELILFSLRRKYANKITIIVNILVFLLCYGALHFDSLVDIDSKKSIRLDKTLYAYHYLFEEKETDNYYYQITDDNADALLYWDCEYVLECNGSISEEMISDITQDLRDVLVLSQNDEVKEIQKIKLKTIQKGDNTKDTLWIVLTVVYLLIISKGSAIAGEIVYEKTSHVLEMIMTNTSAEKHLFSKIATCYITPLIQGVLNGLYIIINIVIRDAQDGFGQLPQLLELYLNENTIGTFSYPFAYFIKCFPVLISGILLFQIIMLLIVSRLSTSEEVGSLQSIIYIMILVMYYGLMLLSERDFFAGGIAEALSYVPIISVFVMSCRIFNGGVSTIQLLISVSMNIVSAIVLLKKMLPAYKENILNYTN